jgi:hypothetical protein
MDPATEHLAALKWELHCARSALQYQSKTQRPERDGSRDEQLAAARARVLAAETAYRPSSDGRSLTVEKMLDGKGVECG